MTHNPITVAILGCGKRSTTKEGWAIGHAHARGWLAAVPNLRLCGVDPSPENLQAFGETFNLPAENLFPSTDALYAALTPDYVSVCTWPSLHAPQVLEAAAKKVKGIACEKPMALDGQEMKSMIDACQTSGTRMVVMHQRRHMPVFEKARQLIADGKIGDGLVLEGRVQDGWDMLSWTSHWFDMAGYLLDATPETILAGCDCTGERRYKQAVENAATVFVEFSGGKQAIFISGPASPEGYNIVVRGSKGLLRMSNNVIKLYTEEGFSTSTEPDAVAGGFGPILGSLVDAVEKGTMPRCDVSLSHWGTTLSYAAQESARTRRTITLPMATRFAPLEVLANPSQPASLGLTGRVVLLADDHYGSGGRTGLAAALRQVTGQEVVDLPVEQGLSEEAVAGAGLLVIYHTQKEPSDATRSVLTAWVAQGKPLLIAHCAVGAYPEWSDYQQWCGRTWDWGKSQHPYEPSQLQAVAGSGFPWSEAWLPKDEVFILLGDRSPVTDVCSVRISSGTHPAAWISKRWPNIAAWIPGHREDLYVLPVMQEGLRTMIQNTLAR